MIYWVIGVLALAAGLYFLDREIYFYESNPSWAAHSILALRSLGGKI